MVEVYRNPPPFRVMDEDPNGGSRGENDVNCSRLSRADKARKFWTTTTLGDGTPAATGHVTRP